MKLLLLLLLSNNTYTIQNDKKFKKLIAALKLLTRIVNKYDSSKTIKLTPQPHRSSTSYPRI